MKKCIAIVVLIFSTIKILHSDIYIRKITNKAKVTSYIIFPEKIGPQESNCEPLPLAPEKSCLLEFGSEEKPIINITKLSQESPLTITIAGEIYQLYYGENKTYEPCICIRTATKKKIIHDARFDSTKDPFLKLDLRQGVLPFLKLIDQTKVQPTAEEIRTPQA